MQVPANAWMPSHTTSEEVARGEPVGDEPGVEVGPDVHTSTSARYPETVFLGHDGPRVTSFVCGFLSYTLCLAFIQVLESVVDDVFG